jgi:ribosomal protein S5
MDAMSDAIEGADVMLYGVSLRYKESVNVSLQGYSESVRVRWEQ